MQDLPFRTSVPAFAWPASITGRAAEVLGIYHQLARSQWWPAERLRAAQLRQLQVLLQHAAQNVPFYRTRLRDAGFDPAAKLDEASWTRIPILTRHDLQSRGARLRATLLPPELGPIEEVATGGSTGIPVRVRREAAHGLFSHAMVCRADEWHGTDPARPMVRIRFAPPGLPPDDVARLHTGDGIRLPDHGHPIAWLHETGPAYVMAHTRDPADQVSALQRIRPGVIATIPANLRLLLTFMRDTGAALSGVNAVWTGSEVADPPLRALCRDVLGCPIVSEYTAHETGYLAIQCPEHEHYHVCSETARVEVLDDSGHPCPPGVVGRVVVTPLQMFAMPLIRYEIGDRAMLGQPCPCGRGLPVLTQIVGRTYDSLVLADGSRRFMGVGYAISKLAAIREYQLVQTVPGAIEARLVVTRPLTAAEEAAALAALIERTGAGVAIHLSYPDALPRTAAGKLRPFISEIG